MDRLTLRNAFSAPDSGREHRLLFETGGNPESNPPPPPRAENLPDFNRLHQRADRPEAQRVDNVYDRVEERQASYRQEVAKLREFLTKAVGDAQEGNVKAVSGLIDRLSNVFQREYVDSNGVRRTYENGTYARVVDIEQAYNDIETRIAGLETALARANGGTLPDGVIPYRDRVMQFRTRQALNNAPNNNGSVDVRTYTRPFNPDYASETSTYSMLRVPTNFRFNWSANPDVARIMAGNYDTVDGSNGITYLRIRPSAATALAGKTIPVDVYGGPGGNTIVERVDATVIAEGAIRETNGGVPVTPPNTLVRIEYSNRRRVDGTPVPPGENVDIPVEDPKVVAERLEKSRTEFHETWLKLKGASEAALKAYESTNPEDTPARILALQQYVKVMGEEFRHLNQDQTALQWPDTDGRTREHANRRNFLRGEDGASGEVQARDMELSDLRDWAGYNSDAEGLKTLTGEAIAAIPPVPTNTADPAAWEAHLNAIIVALGTMDNEDQHYLTFPGSSAERGATETQRDAINARHDEVAKLRAEQEEARDAAQEGLDEAKRQEFHNKWQELNKDTTDAEMAFSETSREDVGATIANLQPFIDAIIAESGHLELRGGIPNTKPGDDRPGQWEERAGEVIRLQGEMETLMTQLVALQEFQNDAQQKQDYTESIKQAANAEEPAENDVTGWEIRIATAQQWQGALEDEQAHLVSFDSNDGKNAATEAHVQAVTDRLDAVRFDIPEAEDLIRVATEGKNEAERQVFQTKYEELNNASLMLEGRYNGVATTSDDMTEKVQFLSEYVDALVAEQDHLQGVDGLQDTKEGGDDRFKVWADRTAELGGDGGLVDRMQQQLQKTEACRDFLTTADGHEQAVESAYNAIPDTDSAANDPDGWQTQIDRTQEYVDALKAEQLHLQSFSGSQSEEVATENQAKQIADRLADVEAAIKDTEGNELPRLNEERNKAECNKFEEDWNNLKVATDAYQADYEASLTNGASPADRLQMATEYADAMKEESDHLDTLNREVHQPGDARLDTYDARIKTLGEDMPRINEMVEKLDDLVDFEQEWIAKQEETEDKHGEIPALPTGRANVEGWQDYKDAIDAYQTAVTDEGGHLLTLPGRPGFGAATETESQTAYDRFMFLSGEYMNNIVQSDEAGRQLDGAKREQFDDRWDALKSETTGARNSAMDAAGMDDFANEQVNYQSLVTALDNEIAHLSTAETGAYPGGDLAAINKAKAELSAERDTAAANVEAARAMEGFDKTRTERNERSEKTRTAADGAVNQMDPDNENLPAWTRRRDAVQTHLTALQAEKDHLDSLPATGRTDGYRDGVQARVTALEAAIKTMEGHLKSMQAGVERANIDNVTNIETAGDVRVNRTQRVDRIINRYQQITLSKPGTPTLTVLAGQNTPDGNRDYPRIEFTGAPNNVVITAGNAPAGTYEITVGTGATAKRSRIIVTGAPPRRRP